MALILLASDIVSTAPKHTLTNKQTRIGEMTSVKSVSEYGRMQEPQEPLAQNPSHLLGFKVRVNHYQLETESTSVKLMMSYAHAVIDAVCHAWA